MNIAARSLAHESELVREVQRGKAAAYRTIAEHYTPRVHNYAHRLLGAISEAEDVTQEVFLRFWQTFALKQLDTAVSLQAVSAQAAPLADGQLGTGSLGSWLLRVAHNACIDRLRRSRRFVDEEPEIVSDSHRPSQLLERRDLALDVQRAVAELPVRQRAALTLCHYEGLGNVAIAEILGVEVSAVESLLARARRTLREGLARHQPSPSELSHRQPSGEL